MYSIWYVPVRSGTYLGGDAQPFLFAFVGRVVADLDLGPAELVSHCRVLDIVIWRKNRLDLINQNKTILWLPLHTICKRKVIKHVRHNAMQGECNDMLSNAM